MRKFWITLGAVLIVIAGQNAFGTTVDLVNNTSGTLNGAAYVRSSLQPTGSGVLDSFVRINPGGTQEFEQGYNTDFRPLQYDENTSKTFTHSLLLSDVRTVAFGGFGNVCTAGCKEFVLDINQTKSDPLLTLNRVVISLRAAGDLDSATVAAGARLTTAASLFPEADFIPVRVIRFSWTIVWNREAARETCSCSFLSVLSPASVPRANRMCTCILSLAPWLPTRHAPTLALPLRNSKPATQTPTMATKSGPQWLRSQRPSFFLG